MSLPEAGELAGGSDAAMAGAGGEGGELASAGGGADAGGGGGRGAGVGTAGVTAVAGDEAAAAGDVRDALAAIGRPEATSRAGEGRVACVGGGTTGGGGRMATSSTIGTSTSVNAERAGKPRTRPSELARSKVTVTCTTSETHVPSATLDHRE
jgi:hypothetical protein